MTLTAAAPTLSILIPTAGRPALAQAVGSYHVQMQPGDELLVLGDTLDGPLPVSEAICAGFGPAVRYIAAGHAAHSFGHDQLNDGLALARGHYLLCNDDDDIAAPGALAAVRAAMADLDQPRPLLFRWRTYWGPVLPPPGVFAEGRIGGHSLVCPNLPGRVGRYGPHYNGDWTYLASTMDRWPNGVADAVWRPEVIAWARPSPAERAAVTALLEVPA